MISVLQLNIYKLISNLFNSKNEFECPFCGEQFKSFLPGGLDIPVLKEKQVVGGGYRLHYHCPICHSLDRERLVYLYLTKKANIFKLKVRLLHVAPEAKLHKILSVQPNISYLSIDLSSNLANVKADITQMSFKENSFDIIICNHVLEHTQNDRKAMHELYRILNPNGWAILQVPISNMLETTYEDPAIKKPEEKEKKFGQRDHVRIYGKDYKYRLEAAGFKVDVFNFVKEFDKSSAYRFGLSKDENIYRCSKES
jgi:predicted SAM-dependent methyltransferase